MRIFALVGIFVFSTIATGYAADTAEFEKNLQMKDATYWAEMQDLKPKVEDYVDSVTSAARAGGHKTLSVPRKKQINGYYCGPASMQMVLAYHGINKTQSVIAGKIGTTEAGSDFPPMKTYLNNQVGSGSYTYVNTADLPFSQGVLYSIDKGKPLICLVDTGKLWYYNYSTDHFVVVKGYDWSFEGPNSTYSTVKVNDPNNKGDYSTKTWTCDFGEIERGLRGVYGWYMMAK